MDPIDPQGVYESGVPNSRAIVHDGIVYVSGVVGIDSETGEYGETMAEQTRFALENVERTLAAAESSLDRVLRVTVYLTDAALKPELDEVYREYFAEPYPTRAAVETGLADDAMVELVVTAHR